MDLYIYVYQTNQSASAFQKDSFDADNKNYNLYHFLRIYFTLKIANTDQWSFTFLYFYLNYLDLLFAPGQNFWNN